VEVDQLTHSVPSSDAAKLIDFDLNDKTTKGLQSQLWTLTRDDRHLSTHSSHSNSNQIAHKINYFTNTQTDTKF